MTTIPRYQHATLGRVNPNAPHGEDFMRLTHVLNTFDRPTYGLSRSQRLQVSTAAAKRAHRRNVRRRSGSRR
jgi:hypothetical protein